MTNAHRRLGISLLLLAPPAPLPGQDTKQRPHRCEMHWTWFAGAALATRENTTFEPGVDAGVSVATAVSRPMGEARSTSSSPYASRCDECEDRVVGRRGRALGGRQIL